METRSKKVPFNESLLNTETIAKASVKSIKDQRIPLLIISAALVLTDILLWIYLKQVGINGGANTALIVAMALGAAHFLYATVTNARFRYGLFVTLPYAVIDLVLFITALTSLTGVTVINGGMAAVAVVLKVLLTAALIVSRFFCLRKSKKAIKQIVAIGLALALLGGFIAFSAEAGVYGEDFGLKDGNKALVYETQIIDGEKKNVVVGLMESSNKNVFIPEKSPDGKAIDVIDCNFFLICESRGVTSLEIGGDKPKSFINVKALSSFGASYKITVDREVIDGYKQYFYRDAAGSGLDAASQRRLYTFAEQFTPQIDEDEYFIAFTYGLNKAPALINDEIIPTWIGKKTDYLTMDVEALVRETTSFASLIDHKADYEWCARNSSYLTWRGFSAKSGKIIDGKVSESTVISIDFENVYRLALSKGAYSYTTPADWKSTVYATVSDVDINLNPTRRGCYVAYWKLSAFNLTKTVSTREDITLALGEADLSSGATVNLFPVWKVETPQILEFSAKSGNKVNNFIYGDKITFGGKIADSALINNTYYSLSYNGNYLYNNLRYADALVFQEYTEKIMTPSENGLYSLTAVTYDSFDRNLYAESTRQIAVSVGKKNLAFSWKVDGESANASYEYDGLAHYLTAELLTQAVANDSINFNITRRDFTDAGKFTSTVTLISGTDRYSVDSPQFNYEVKCAPLTVDAQSQLIYNGKAQALSVKVNGAKNGEIPAFQTAYYASSVKNAGDYQAAVTLTDGENFKKNNYTFSTVGNELVKKISFAILPYTVDALEWSDTSLVYSGKVQQPTARFEGVGEDSYVSMNVNNGQKDVGSYVAEAINVNGNYQIAAVRTQEYTIVPMVINTVNWSAKSFVYNGYEQSPTAYFAGAGTDGNIPLTVSGKRKDKGTFTATAANGNNNYTLAVNSAEISITAAPVYSVKWTGDSVTYNGRSQSPKASYSGVGEDGEIALTVVGSRKDVGTYQATASNANDNYSVRATLTRNCKIKPYGVDTISWQNLEFTFDNTVHKPTAKFMGIAEDGEITLDVTADAKNAGAYVARAVCRDSNYTLNNPNKAYTIKPYSISDIMWSRTSLIYNGTTQKPQASIQGAFGEGTIELTITAHGRNVGTYSATAVCPDTNYALSNAAVNYGIAALEISQIVWGNVNFEYNASGQAPQAYFVGAGTDGNIPLTVSGEARNVGEYTASATCEDGNYRLNGTFVKNYSITPKGIEHILWSGSSSAYNGYMQSPTAAFTGMGEDGIISMNISGGRKDAGTYTAKADNINANYQVTAEASKLCEITPYIVENVIFDKTVFIYNGLPQTPQAYFYGVADEGIIDLSVSGERTDYGAFNVALNCVNGNYTLKKNTQSCFIDAYKVDNIVWVGVKNEYTGLAIKPSAYFVGVGTDGKIILNVSGEARNAGTYTATASLDNDNYRLSGETEKEFSITRKEIAAVWIYSEYHNDGEVDNIYVRTDEVPSSVIYYEYYYQGALIDVSAITEGNYVKKVVCSDKNYLFTDDEYAFTVNAKEAQL